MLDASWHTIGAATRTDRVACLRAASAAFAQEQTLLSEMRHAFSTPVASLALLFVGACGSIVDPVRAREIHRTPRICGFPIALDIGVGNLVWIACFGSSELVAVSRDDYAAVHRVALGDAPLNVVAHPERPFAYVSLPRANAVEEVDLVTGEVTRRVVVGIEPDGLRWAAR